jgi:hypothetical protein
MANKIVTTPVQGDHSSSCKPSGSVKTNGVPGLPQRTGNGIPEVTYDQNGGLASGKK